MNRISHAIHRGARFLGLSMFAALYAGQGVWAQTPAGNSIESLQAVKQGEAVVLKLTLKNPPKSPPSSFSIASPARLAFDFSDTTNGLGRNAQPLNVGDLHSANIVEVGGRTRLVLNLNKMMAHDTRIDGQTLYISMSPIAAQGAAAAGASPTQHFAAVDTAEGRHGIRDIAFRRGEGGEGRVVVDLSDSNAGVDIRRQGTNLVIDFQKTSLPENLTRRLDVTDFATPVATVSSVPLGENARVTISPRGNWEHNAYQIDNRFIVEVKQIVEDPKKLVQGSRSGYQGEKVSLNFQNIPLRELLHVFADITNFNIVASDTVGGSISLRLNDVPWDQALEIVLQQKNLAMRKNGNVLLIAPSDELIAKEKKELESSQQLTDLEATRTESFQVNYQKADDIQKLLTNKDQRVLSKRGSAVVDAYTNRVFVTDTPSRLNDVRQLIQQIDIPVKQVLIEARIIEANENFGRDLGVRMNLFNTQPVKVGSQNEHDIFLGGGLATAGAQSATGRMAYTQLAPAGPMGGLSFSLFNAALTRVLNLEILAMETDGKGRRLSNPRVVTGNNVKALIEDGMDIPIVTPGTANAPPTATYRKAKLSLGATPQITPDGRIKMKLEIGNERPDFTNVVLGNPAIISSKVDTDVMVENGGTLVIGGVTIGNETVQNDRIPFLGDLPYVGFLFKHRTTTQTRRELLVFITPKILDENLAVR